MNGKRITWLTIATVTLGIIVGVCSGALTLLLYTVERFALGYVESSRVPGPFHVTALRRIVSVVLGSAIAAVIWWLLRSKTTRVPSVGKAVKGETMPVWQTIVHVVLQIGIVGCGSSIGREVAPRELGAMLAQRLTSLKRFGSEELSDKDRSMIVAAAAAAGLAGVYNAPLAGLFFVLELLITDISVEMVGVCLGMSTISAFIATAVKGGAHAFYVLPDMPQTSTLSLMLFALIAGVCAACIGTLFRRATNWAQSGSRNDAGIVWKMPLAALFTGIVAIWVPQVMGNGRAMGTLAFDTTAIARLMEMGGSATGRDSHTLVTVILPILAISFAAKAVVTILTIRAGASGGVLQPGIALGASLGAILGVFWTLICPGDSLGACALIGASATLAASQRAPLMAMFLVLELCDAPMTLFVPVCLAVATSSMVCRWLDARSGAVNRAGELTEPAKI